MCRLDSSEGKIRFVAKVQTKTSDYIPSSTTKALCDPGKIRVSSITLALLKSTAEFPLTSALLRPYLLCFSCPAVHRICDQAPQPLLSTHRLHTDIFSKSDMTPNIRKHIADTLFWMEITCASEATQSVNYHCPVKVPSLCFCGQGPRWARHGAAGELALQV